MGASSSSSALGKSSTARDVVTHFAADLTGKTALVTGASSGIGLETVKALTSAGCRVIATARDVPAGEAAIAAYLSAPSPYAGNPALVTVLPLNLERLASVRALAAAAQAAAPEGFSLVVLNAGIMALPARETTPAGFEKQIGVNHFAHHLLVSLLRPALVARADRPARIVYVSSLAHARGGVDVADLHFAKGRAYSPWVAYGQSKKANMLEARELADQLRASAPHITVASLHPGVIATNLARHMTILNNFLVVRCCEGRCKSTRARSPPPPLYPPPAPAPAAPLL